MNFNALTNGLSYYFVLKKGTGYKIIKAKKKTGYKLTLKSLATYKTSLATKGFYKITIGIVVTNDNSTCYKNFAKGKKRVSKIFHFLLLLYGFKRKHLFLFFGYFPRA